MVTTGLTRVAMVAALFAVGCGAARQHAKIQQEGEALRFDLAALYVDKGVPQAAAPLLQKILAESPRDVRARVMYGVVLRDMDLYPQAERELRFALSIEPGNAAAAIGILYDLQRKPEPAKRHHIAAVRLSPGDAAYRNNLGFSLYLAGDIPGAISQLEQALAMDPSLTIAYNNLGFAYGRAHQFDRAERVFRAALGEASTLLNMAMVHDDLGEHDEATALRERAYELDPDLRPEHANNDDDGGLDL
jgi:Tfp pilus assembly protein PilF